MARRDPEIIGKQIIMAVYALVGLVASGIAVTACARAFFVHGDSPVMLVGILGGLLGIAASLYFAWLAMNPRRASRRR